MCQFGDLSMGQLPVGQFQGPKENVLYKPPPHHFPPNMKSCGASAVPGPEVPVTILQNMVEAAASPEEKQEAQARLAELRTNRGFMEGVVRAVVDTVTGDSDLTDTMFSDNVELTRWTKVHTVYRSSSSATVTTLKLTVRQESIFLNLSP